MNLICTAVNASNLLSSMFKVGETYRFEFERKSKVIGVINGLGAVLINDKFIIPSAYGDVQFKPAKAPKLAKRVNYIAPKSRRNGILDKRRERRYYRQDIKQFEAGSAVWKMAKKYSRRF